jgi:hypothetical protein
MDRHGRLPRNLSVEECAVVVVVFSKEDESQQSIARRNLPFQGFKIDLQGQEQVSIREGWVTIGNGLQTQLKTNFCAYKL